MKNIMSKAWEIFRTLTGDYRAKLSIALKMAWAEARTSAKTFSHNEAIVKMMESFGYEVERNGFEYEHCWCCTKEITIKYAEYKNNKIYSAMKTVYNSYNKADKTIKLINKVFVWGQEDKSEFYKSLKYSESDFDTLMSILDSNDRERAQWEKLDTYSVIGNYYSGTIIR